MDLTDERQLALESARSQWAEGEGRVQRFTEDSGRRALLETLVERLVLQLERRVGQTFSLMELVEAYRGAEVWVGDTVHAGAPEQTWAWDSGLAGDAAFHRYARRARDWRP